MGKKRKPEILPSASNIPTEAVLQDWARCIREVWVADLLTPDFSFRFVYQDRLEVKAVEYQAKYPDYNAAVANMTLGRDTLFATLRERAVIRAKLCPAWQAYFYLVALSNRAIVLYEDIAPAIILKGYYPYPEIGTEAGCLQYGRGLAHSFSSATWLWSGVGDEADVFRQLPHTRLQQACVHRAYVSIANPAGFRFLLSSALEHEDLSGFMPGYYRAAFEWHTQLEVYLPKLLKLERLCGSWWEMGWAQPEESVTARRARRVEQTDL